MDKKYQNRKQADLVKTMCASLLIVPAIFTTASVVLARPLSEADNYLSQANPSPDSSNQTPSGTSISPLNPRPSIFNEPPYNRSQSTSPTDVNAAPTTQPLLDSGVTPTTETTPGAITPPLPEQQTPSAIATPVDGKINIKLINTTNSVVSYQVIGDTNQRFLSGDSNFTLQNIKTPVTVTFRRQDNGLLKVNPQATSEGLLEVTLDEATSLNEDNTTMRIQQDGKVLLN